MDGKPLPRFAPRALEDLATAIFSFHGVSDQDARETARCLTFADRSGLGGHGLIRLKLYIDRIRAGGCNPRPNMVVTREHGATCVIDADNALGPVAAMFGMRRAMEAASKVGVGVAVVRNANHFGAASYYARHAAEHGMVAIVASNVQAAMPAPGGTKRVIGNNPVAFAFPLAGEPIVFDACCSKSTFGVLMSALRDGTLLPEGCFFDRHGRPTRDPDAGRLSNGGMIAPMGEHKGFGLALALSLLTGALGGDLVDPEIENPFASAAARGGNSFILITLDLAAFVPPEIFAAKAQVITTLIHATAAEGTRTRVPGERAAEARAQSEHGLVLSEATARELRALAEEARIEFPRSKQ